MRRQLQRRELITLASSAALNVAARGEGTASRADAARLAYSPHSLLTILKGLARVCRRFGRPLQRLGWGRRIAICKLDIRWAGGDGRALAPKTRRPTWFALCRRDVLLGGRELVDWNAAASLPFRPQSCFVTAADPVAAGLSSIAWHAQAATLPAFSHSTTVSAQKWLELLKEIFTGPGASWRPCGNPAITAAIGQFAVIQAAAPRLAVEARRASTCGEIGEIEGVVFRPSRAGPTGGLIVTASVLAVRGPEPDKLR